MGVALLSQVSPPSSDPSTRHLLLDKFEVKSLNFVLIDLSPAARPLGQRHSLAPDRLHQLPATPTSSLATAIPAPAPRSASVAYTSPRQLVPLYRATPLHFYILSCPPHDPLGVICSLSRILLQLVKSWHSRPTITPSSQLALVLSIHHASHANHVRY